MKFFSSNNYYTIAPYGSPWLEFNVWGGLGNNKKIKLYAAANPPPGNQAWVFKHKGNNIFTISPTGNSNQYICPDPYYTGSVRVKDWSPVDFKITAINNYFVIAPTYNTNLEFNVWGGDLNQGKPIKLNGKARPVPPNQGFFITKRN